jgi:hypothetical protein
MNVLKKLFHLIRETVHHAWWHLVIFLLVAGIKTVWNSFSEDVNISDAIGLTADFVKSHPIISTLPIVAFVLVKKALELYADYGKRILRISQLETLISKVGIRSFSHHDNSDEKNTDWNQCKQDLSDPTANQLNILGAAGYETFSSSDSPLHDFVSDFSGDLRVLLLDPNSEAFKQRCANTKTREDQYKDWIYKSIEFCQKLKIDNNRSVEVRLYSDYPIWKIIFTPEYMWLQWYQNKNVDDTQVYCFQTTKDKHKTSLYYPLSSVFRRRWESGIRIDLNTWERPRRAKRA